MTEKNDKILIVDDEEDMCALLSHLLKREGFNTLVALDGNTALEMIRLESPGVLLLDKKMPGLDGIEVLRRVKELDENISVVMVTAYGDIRGAVEAMKLGAHDYLAKPFDNLEVLRVIQRALTEQKLKQKIKDLSNQIQETNNLREMMGPSDSVSRLVFAVNTVAKSNFSIIISGETGSGKELVAHAIHQYSPRSKYPFIPIDCGSIPETLLESELFGYEKGAFTGADTRKSGKFEMAQGGTLFLDEISNMPLGSQAKFLRVLQEKSICHLGSTKNVKVDVRIIVASHQNLLALSDQGLFRKDLYYRLNEFSINIPPLHERKEDIPYLAKRFLDMTNKELKKQVRGFSEDALEVLFNYNWPGNVRQLRSAIRRATLLADDIITEKHLDLRRASVPELAFTPKVQGTPWKHNSLREIICQSSMAVEREVITQVLRYSGGNKAKAARLLQVDYKTIHTKAKKFGICSNGGGHD